MNDYTPDNICRAMGLGRFDPGSGESLRVGRLLLKPSFEAEVCLTVAMGKVSSVEVVVLIEQLWPKMNSYRGEPEERWQGDAEVNASEAKRLIEGLEEVLKNVYADGDLVLDGMGFDGLVRTADDVLTTCGNVWTSSVRRERLRQLVQKAYDAVGDPGCRLGLANAGDYLNMNLLKPEIETPPKPLSVAILGPAEDKAQLLRALSKASAADKSAEKLKTEDT